MGGSSKKQTVGYKYFFGLHMGIGRGPVDALHEIRVADKQAWYGRATGNTTIQINKPDLFGGEKKEGGVKGPLELMMGGPDQEASSGIKAMLGNVLPGFRGAFTAFYNGLVSVNNPYPKAWKFRLNRVLKGWDGPVWNPSKAQIPLDPTIAPPAINEPCAMNPAHIIYECLTNRVWGRGLSASKIDLDSFLAAADTLYAERFGLCLKWTRKDSIENFIQGVIDHIGATLYVSRTTKLYTIKLIRGGYNLNDLPLFDTESGILSISDASVASIGSTVNAVQVKYHDWENDEERTVSVKNAAAIVSAGGIVNQVTRDFPGIPVVSLALRVAQRELRAVSTALRKFTITMDRRGEDFAPGDVFAIQDPKRGIPKMAVRVGRVEDGTLLDGKITLTVVQDVFTLPATTMAADVPSSWVPPNTTPCIDQQHVFEAPYFLMVRTMSKADLDYVGQDSGYIATLNSQGQPLNQGHTIAVRPDAPTVDDNPADDSYSCGV